MLTRAFPPDLVDQVLLDCGRVEQRSRLLPARVVVYFVLAMGLFAERGYPDVARLLAADLAREPWWPHGGQLPTAAAIGRARLRLGPEPLRHLFERTCPPPAARTTADAWFLGRRLVALDGAILDVPDTPPNAAHFGRSLGGAGRTAPRTPARAKHAALQEPVSYPQARVSALVECGTNATLAADVGPLSTHERALAGAIYPTLTRDMLVLADRGTTDPATWHAARAGGADLLWQVPGNVRLPFTARLADGSHLAGPSGPTIPTTPAPTALTALTALAALMATPTTPTTPAVPIVPAAPGREHPCPAQIRVIDYTLDTDRPGARPRRLLTSLLDPAAAPAADLAARYAQQSRSGTALDRLTPPQPARTLRSRHPDGIEQEIFALLLLHRAFPGPTGAAPVSPASPAVQLVSEPH
ncbi:IS4 family transposase [Kitasatospora sp. NPDC092948]|uniref:IS4 family transposase n=1 Tax=Kitasatospora sp. NPDC092948 TaxID=3364088 RepID=UPI0038246D00